MTLTIHSTEVVTRVHNVPVRVWEGVTPNGVRCVLFIHRLAVHNDQDSAEFDADLMEQLPPAVFKPLGEILQ